MRKMLILAAVFTVAGCAKGGTAPPPTAANAAVAKAPDHAPSAPVAIGVEPADLRRAAASGAWIGASAAGEVLAASTRETFVGVWVDVPESRPSRRPPLDVALVVDTSGSMKGPKIDNARAAATMLVRSLRDGDMVSLDSFSDHARSIVPPTRLDAASRGEILREIAALTPVGSTNMFEGLMLAESQMAGAPATHSLRRIVLISDGRANVGPASPEILGQFAERGLRFGAQITSLGVGNDYDERTLNALAVRSSGRIFHIGEASEMAGILRGELERLDGTLASDAQIEVVPAPGVTVLGADTVRSEWQGGSLRIPLGALFAGQHREALVRVRITDPAIFEAQARTLASVRLRFKDSQDGDLERIQETVARLRLSNDADAIARTESSRAQAIFAMNVAAQTQLQAAQHLNDRSFADADKDLAKAQATLEAQARQSAPAEKKRLEAAANRVAATRSATKAMPAAPRAAARAGALELNADTMHLSGY